MLHPTEKTSTEKIIFPIEAIVYTIFFPLLKGTTLELCKIGHRMEHVYGKELLQINDENGGIKFSNGIFFRVLFIYRAGLVGRINRDYQKDSPGFVVHGILDDVHIIAILEMKARCSSSTAAKERRKNNVLHNYSYVSCYSNDLRKRLLKKREAVQVKNAFTLHHSHAMLNFFRQHIMPMLLA